ncbi:MAG: UDP-3-O-acyl-N-acetylglucosamine deacetylase [Firmicutes bacterium]|nr:UDP-3-O-acyl-N-acetylglucosamine deacetylase [Bacillota bacterium]
MTRSRQPQTLRQPITIQGRGLHGNRPCQVTIRPVEQPTGLRFLHGPTGIEIPAKADLVGDLSLATTLVKDGLRFGTVEHLLSALMGLEIEHALIEVDSEELPILDGSATPWVEALSQVGTQSLPGLRRFIKVLRPVEVKAPNKWIRVSPHSGLRLRYTIDFDHPAIGRQSRELSLTPEKYRRELASARTFCMDKDIEYMRSKGLALGGSLENAVVFSAQGPLNETLRFEDEAVRHKMLDLVGDLALLGAPLLGLVEAHAAGHALHVALAKALLADTDAWTWQDADAASPRRHAPLPMHAGFNPAPALA